MDWISKYAPSSLDEVMGNKETIRTLREYITNPDSMPHLLFYGVTGTGKTTLANILVNQMLDYKEMDYREMNASDDRVIDNDRQRIIPFMRYAPCGVRFKILILDEADAPLDDANVSLFRGLVKDIASNSQVIFVTHNKTTMELAEQLLGVTMREAGVSRLVAVDVDEAAQMVTA